MVQLHVCCASIHIFSSYGHSLDVYPLRNEQRAYARVVSAIYMDP
jgi:hypothetical protein